MSLLAFYNAFNEKKILKVDAYDLQVESLVYAPAANSLFVRLSSGQGHEFDLRCVAKNTGAVSLYISAKKDSALATCCDDLAALRSWLRPHLARPAKHSAKQMPKRKLSPHAQKSNSYSVNAW